MITRALAVLLASGFMLANAGAPRPEVEEVALGFADAMNQMQAKKMTDYLHPEFLSYFASWVRRLAQESDSQPDRDDFFKKMNVKSTADLKKLSDAVITERFWVFTWSLTSPEFRKVSGKTAVKVIGSIQEGDLMHVFIRYSTDVKGDFLAVPTVITLKKDGQSWKVLSSTFFQNMRSKLSQ